MPAASFGGFTCRPSGGLHAPRPPKSCVFGLASCEILLYFHPQIGYNIEDGPVFGSQAETDHRRSAVASREGGRPKLNMVYYKTPNSDLPITIYQL
ncbi:MAG: hypothetical protein ACYS32_15390, partial [Planctomycetota bacterium]